MRSNNMLQSNGQHEQEADDDLDARWNQKFGEPSTEVFTPEEFLEWFKEVMAFDANDE